MRFKNEQHKGRFMKAIKRMDQKNPTQMAVAFLLTAEKKLWDSCRIYIISNEIPIYRIRVKRCSENGYVLFCAAKDIALGTKYVSMNDLVDRDIVSSENWQLIFTALEIKRFGVGMVIPQRIDSKKENGGEAK